VTAARARSAPRLGVFGGTFDPPHLAHLAVAERAREQLRLERVVFVPAADPPHKRARAKTPFRQRLAMTRLAIRGHAGFAVSDLESRRPGPSYTVETLRAMRRRHPRHELVLVLGADSLADLRGWRDPQAILGLARIAVAPRPPGGGRPRLRWPAGARGRVTRLDCPLLDVSSSDLRARARRGESLRYLVPDAVAAYVRRRRLYRGGA
jgi:nicotinate-nucleotide adenylyltransferase